MNEWDIYRPQPSSNLELKTIKSRNFGIRRLHLLTGEVAPPGRARRLSLWAVPPLSEAVAPLCQSLKTELRQLHRLTGEVAPPGRARNLSSGRLHLLAGAVAPPSLAGRHILGGCTSWLGWLHRPVFAGRHSLGGATSNPSGGTSFTIPAHLVWLQTWSKPVRTWA